MINKQSNENKIKPKKSNYMKNEYDNSLADKSNSIHSYRIHSKNCKYGSKTLIANVILNC